MPYRPLRREQAFLLPPTLEDLVPADHPARFVAAFVDALDPATWADLGVSLDGTARGAPAYHPRALLSVWLYGFMRGIRSTRTLARACTEQIPCLWLTGGQSPDHNTLWRFYTAHRPRLQALFRRTVRTAVAAGLVDLAVQAVDGTKVAGNAARERTLDARGLAQLLARTEAAIADLDAQSAGGAPAPARLPAALADKHRLRDQVAAALGRVRAAEEGARVNLTDPAARLMKGRQGYVAGYNAQAVASPLPAGAGGGAFLTAVDVVATAADSGQLLPLLQAAETLTGARAATTLADGGYHSGANLVAVAARAQTALIPEGPQARKLRGAYHKTAFTYLEASDSYRCPRGQQLYGSTERRNRRGLRVRVYRAAGPACRACPAFGTCTRDRAGRTLEVVPDEDGAILAQRALMATAAAQARYRLRKQLIEPVFGVLKEQQGARRFLVRGLGNVRAEWTLLATAFNLRVLWRAWAGRAPAERAALLAA